MAKTEARPGLRVRKLADKSEGRRVRMLVAPPAAVVRDEAGNYLIDPERCARRLVNPDTPGTEHESWPLAGIAFEGDPPATARIPTSLVKAGKAELWLTLEDEEVVHRPAGPAEDPWKGTPHTFHHATALVFHTIHGDVRYLVTVQPDKQHPNREGEPGEVWHFYDVELDA